mgnify:CR=1 FL=1
MKDFDLKKYLAEGKLNEFVGKELEDRNEPLYNELVPGQGDAETVEGEMLRAINRIVYRYYNDGDEYHTGYGTETAGPAHSFLVNANHPLRSLVSALFKKGTNYEQTIKDVLDANAEALVIHAPPTPPIKVLGPYILLLPKKFLFPPIILLYQ